MNKSARVSLKELLEEYFVIFFLFIRVVASVPEVRRCCTSGESPICEKLLALDFFRRSSEHAAFQIHARFGLRKDQIPLGNSISASRTTEVSMRYAAE